MPEKLIVVKMDNQLGPKPLFQFPPAEDFLPKEKFLKIWAQHETQSEGTKYIHFFEKEKVFISLSKKKQNNAYFIVVVAKKKKKDDTRIIREVLENVSDELINNLDDPNFTHILHESFDTIKNYAQIDEYEMFSRLFEDKIRITILDLLQVGTISKRALKEKLKKKFGYTTINLELFLTPFLRLNLIEVKDIHGIKGVIFLKNDVFVCKIPPKQPPSNKEVKKSTINMFSNPQFVPMADVRSLVALLRKLGVKKLMGKLEKSKNGISYTDAMKILGNNEDVLENLQRNKFIMVIDKKKVFLLSKLSFIRFGPDYVFPKLVDGYFKKNISADQLLMEVQVVNKGRKITKKQNK